MLHVRAITYYYGYFDDTLRFRYCHMFDIIYDIPRRHHRFTAVIAIISPFSDMATPFATSIR